MVECTQPTQILSVWLAESGLTGTAQWSRGAGPAAAEAGAEADAAADVAAAGKAATVGPWFEAEGTNSVRKTSL